MLKITRRNFSTQLHNSNCVLLRTILRIKTSEETTPHTTVPVTIICVTLLAALDRLQDPFELFNLDYTIAWRDLSARRALSENVFPHTVQEL